MAITCLGAALQDEPSPACFFVNHDGMSTKKLNMLCDREFNIIRGIVESFLEALLAEQKPDQLGIIQRFFLKRGRGKDWECLKAAAWPRKGMQAAKSAGPASP